MKTGPKPIPEIERFKQRFAVAPNGCWLWRGANNTKYGVFRIGSLSDKSRKMVYAHRWSFEHHNGPIGKGLFVCHKCDTPLCVNPEHLFLGTNSENLQDAVKKGVSIGGRNVGEANGGAVLSASDVLRIRELHINGLSLAKIAKRYDLSKNHVWHIVTKQAWAHL